MNVEVSYTTLKSGDQCEIVIYLFKLDLIELIELIDLNISHR